MSMLNFMHILMEVTKPWNFTYYNYYPTHPLKWKGWVGFFGQICDSNTFFDCGP